MMKTWRNLIAWIKLNYKIILILLCGLVLRLWGLKASLPINFADEETYVVGALRLGQGDLNPHSFINPSLMIYVNFVLFGVYFAFGKIFLIFNSLNDFKHLFYENPTGFYLLARFLTVIFGLLSVFVLYKMVRFLYSEQSALIASLLFAVLPLYVSLSQNAKCDVAMVFLILSSLFYLMKYHGDNQRKHYFIGCFLCGLAISTKYTAAPLFITCLLAYLLQSDLSAIRKNYQVLLGGSTLILAGFLLCTPFAVFDFGTFISDIHYLADRNKIPWFGMEGARIGLWEYALKAFPLSLGWSVYACALLGIITCFSQIGKKEIILYSFPLGLFIILAQTRNVSVNYALPLYPFFCILAAFFMAGVIKTFRRKPLQYAFTFLVVAVPLALVSVNNHNRSTIDTRFIAKDWIEAHVPTDKKIASEGLGVIVPNHERIMEILLEIKDPKRGGQLRYYLENVQPKSYYCYDFPLFECIKLKQDTSDEDRRRCAEPNASDYDFHKIKKKFDYMILSSHVYSRFEAYPSLYPKQNEFYNKLRSEALLLKVIGNDSDSRDHGAYFGKLFKFIGLADYQGPVIQIFRL